MVLCPRRLWGPFFCGLKSNFSSFPINFHHSGGNFEKPHSCWLLFSQLNNYSTLSGRFGFSFTFTHQFLNSSPLYRCARVYVQLKTAVVQSLSYTHTHTHTFIISRCTELSHDQSNSRFRYTSFAHKMNVHLVKISLRYIPP